MFLKFFLGVLCTTYFATVEAANDCIVSKNFNNLRKVETCGGVTAPTGGAPSNSGSVCVLADNRIECFKSPNNEYPMITPQISNPVELVSNDSVYCALGDEGVRCWSNWWEERVPKLKNPKNLTVQRGAACAKTDDGIKCWNYKGEIALPSSAKDASEVALGGDWSTNYGYPQFGCALNNGTVNCWGDNFYGQTSPPRLVNPRQLVAGENSICALTDEGVKCWGSWEEHGQTIVPKLGSVVQLDVGEFYGYCALERTGNTACWGGILKYLRLPGKHEQISAGRDLVCGKSGDTVTCVGYKDSHEDSCPVF